MRLVKFPVILALLSNLVFFSLSSGEEKTQYFEVKVPMANVYKALDPKSEIIKQVLINERLEVLAQGTSWHNVKVDGKSGWIENQTGKLVDSQKSFPVFSLIFLLLLIGGTGAFVYTRISKTKQPETEEI